mmetsp:Transcript_71787/g.166043  ORF Transcript_71787/g.166043 Transcript_71787/m.166043 type:complete len:419 (-) Transcript_71787:46-1302(-)
MLLLLVMWNMAFCIAGTAAIIAAIHQVSEFNAHLAEFPGPVPPHLQEKAVQVQKTLQMMERNPEDPKSIATGCSALGGTAYHGGKAVQDLVVDFGGVEACINGMKKFVGDPQVVQMCGSGLGGIIVFNPHACQVSAAAGGIDALGAGMRAHLDDRNVMLAIDVFSSHCDLNPENRPKVRDAGGIDLIFGSMQRFYRDGEVQFKNWAGLSATVHDPGNREAIAKGGGWCPPGCGTGKYQGIELLVQTMRDLRGSYRVNQEAMQVVKGLCDHSAEYREALVAAGAVEEIVNTIRARAEDELGTPCVGAEALTRFAVANATHRARIAETGVVSDILVAMQRRLKPDESKYGGLTNADVWPTLPSGCQFLEVMALDSQNQVAIKQNNSVTSMLSNLATHGDEFTRTTCSSLLKRLGTLKLVE